MAHMYSHMGVIVRTSTPFLLCALEIDQYGTGYISLNLTGDLIIDPRLQTFDIDN